MGVAVRPRMAPEARFTFLERIGHKARDRRFP